MEETVGLRPTKSGFPHSFYSHIPPRTPPAAHRRGLELGAETPPLLGTPSTVKTL